jgi:hypothetical protein
MSDAFDLCGAGAFARETLNQGTASAMPPIQHNNFVIPSVAN